MDELKTKNVTITGLEIYEAVFDSARSELVPENFAGKVEDIKQYAENVWNITLSDEEAKKIAQAHDDLLIANEKDGQWSFNYDTIVGALSDMKFKGWMETYEN